MTHDEEFASSLHFDREARQRRMPAAVKEMFGLTQPVPDTDAVPRPSMTDMDIRAQVAGKRGVSIFNRPSLSPMEAAKAGERAAWKACGDDIDAKADADARRLRAIFPIDTDDDTGGVPA